METNLQPNARLCMQRRALQRLSKVRPGTTLSCDCGVLWVTQTGDREDHILWPGDVMAVTDGGTVLVQALRDAAFHFA